MSNNIEEKEDSNETIKIETHNQYHSSGLEEKDLLEDPIELFKKWFKEAERSNLVKEPEAMCLSTSTKKGKISSRFLLLKKVDKKGFIFFTNYNSRKFKELNENLNASLAFYWKELNQQIRINGITEKISLEESYEYFKSRPIGSQLGAWSSPQSKPIKDRNELLDLIHQNENKFNLEIGSINREIPSEIDLNSQLPLPPHWGGVRLIPDEIEFWSGRPNRLHDRFLYSRSLDDPSSKWTINRLAP